MYHVPFAGRHTPTLAAVAPVPVSEIDCGLFAALSDTVRLADRLPVVDGLNVTDTEQDAPAASVLPQVVVRVKSAGFAPETAMLEIVNAAAPEFVRVTDFDELAVPTVCEPKLRLVGERPALGAGAAPVPLSGALCGLAAALSAIVKLAVLVPVAEGENVTDTVQDAPAGIVVGLVGHVVAHAKSAGFAPDTAMLEIVRPAVPEFVTVTGVGELDVPTC
jgi:hypothetical protein